MNKPRHLTTYTDEQYAKMIKKVRDNRVAKSASKITNPEAYQQSLAKVKANTQHTQPHLFNGDKPLARSWSYKAKKSVRKSKKSVRKSKKSVRKSKKSVRKSKKSLKK
jgi:hypothetical protein